MALRQIETSELNVNRVTSELATEKKKRKVIFDYRRVGEANFQWEIVKSRGEKR